jgi:hypothetical protein
MCTERIGWEWMGKEIGAGRVVFVAAMVWVIIGRSALREPRLRLLCSEGVGGGTGYRGGRRRSMGIFRRGGQRNGGGGGRSVREREVVGHGEGSDTKKTNRVGIVVLD